MAERVGKWASDGDVRNAVNATFEQIEQLDIRIGHLNNVIAAQADEILHLRAQLMGIIELLHARLPFRDLELDEAVASALQQLTPPPPIEQPHTTDPYRGLPSEPAPEMSPEEIAAKQLLRTAEEHHFAKRFADARDVYREIVDRYAETETAEVASQQLDNLRGLLNER